MTTTTAPEFTIHLYSDCTNGHPILRDETVMIAKATCAPCIARNAAR